MNYFSTKKMRFYLVKFAFRIIAFIIMLSLYLTDRERFYEYTVTPVTKGLNFMHIMWCVYMGLMILHIFPGKVMSMGAGKIRRAYYVPVEGYSEEKLLKYVQNENRKAWKVMLFWIFANGIFGILYYTGIIGKPELVLLTTFYFLSDYICILIFCPFQTFGQKDRCCVACRIYDWGHFFMFTPMLFIGTFYSQTLFWMGTAVIVHWEVMFTMHPERFWDGSNQAIRCANCNDKTCTVKRQVTRNILDFLKK
ncbi:MAG: hypothetical protein K5979_06615 [Ruminococcus sp.]|nr:hypothetical protein [Ruminococcus sp.]